MRFILIGLFLTTALFGMAFTASAAATPLDEETYLDLKVNADRTLQLTAAFSPRHASTIVSGAANIKDLSVLIAKLKTQRELIASFVASHVAATRDGKKCRWEPDLAHVPATLLEAQADGVTVQAPLICDTTSGRLNMTSDLFGFATPLQRIVVREESSDDYNELAVIDASHHTVGVTLNDDLRPESTAPMGSLLIITFVGCAIAGGIIWHVRRLTRA